MLGEESREPRTGTGPSLSPLPPCPRALSPSWAALAPGGTDVLLKSVVNVWSQLSMSKVSCLLRCLKSVVYVWSQLSTRDIWSQLSTEISEVSCLRRCLTSRLMSLSSSSPVWGTLALQVYVPPSLFLTDLMIRPSGSITYRSPAGRINSLLIVTTSFFSSFLPNDKNDFSIERRSSFIHILLLIIGFQ